MKIGILGGTFDPIHIGHLLLGEFAYVDFGLDEIWFLPNGSPPHKNLMAEQDFHLNHRINMVKLAIKEVDYFNISLHEARNDIHSYTYQTLGYFNQKFPQHDFYFILGADSLFSIEKWRYFEEIFPKCTILAAMRDDRNIESMLKQIENLKDLYHAKIEILRAPLLDISSTTIRERINRGLSARFMIPDSVLEYISGKQLYYSGTFTDFEG